MALQLRLLAAEGFPARHGDVDELRRQLHRVAGAPELLGGDQRGARSREGLVEEPAGPGVVADRATDGLHRLHRRMDGPGAVVDLAGDLPDRLGIGRWPVSYTHLRAHETRHDLVCR